MIVVATNAPLSVHNLQRLSKRAIMGLARNGSFASNGSGDYVIAFTTDPALRVLRQGAAPVAIPQLPNSSMSPLFAATEEAIYNAILKATSVSSARGSLKAIPLEVLVQVLRKYNVLETKRPASRYLFCKDYGSGL